MELNDVINNSYERNQFILLNYEPIQYLGFGPVYPYKVNFRSKEQMISFCGISVIDSWIFKLNFSFTFFLLLRNNIDLEEKISGIYGPHYMETNLEANGQSMGGASYRWKDQDINIFLESFIDTLGVKKYENCTLIMIGNMSLADIIPRPDKGPF